MEAPKLTNLLPPEARVAVGMANHVWRHPMAYASAAVLGFGAIYGAQGYLASEFNVHESTSIDVEDQGHGEVVDIDLDIPEVPLVGFTAKVTDAKTALSHNLHIKVGPLEVNPSTGTDTMTWGGLIDTTIDYDPAKITAQYDPGLVNDPEDDKIILHVPLGAFSVHPEVLPEGQTTDFGSDLWSLPRNVISAWGDSVTMLKNVPGISNVADARNETEQILIGFTQVNALNNVANTCSPLVASNETVYQAIRQHIGDQALLAVSKSQKLHDMDLSFNQVSDMKVVVEIGAETDQPGQEVIIGQKINTTNPYTERVKEIDGIKDVNLQSGGTFSCELSDEVKQKLADISSTQSASPSPEETTK